jgi:E-phenylitaconyl-CoA hydratase
MGLVYEKRDGIGHFIIDNGKMNVITPQIHKDFFHRLKEFEIDAEARVGLLYGAGGRSFSAGDDIKNKYRPQRTRHQELEAALFLHQGEGDTPTRPGWEEDVYRHRRYKPIIGAVSGYCIGAGLAYLLLHTDIRIADSSAKFGLPELGFGAAGLSATTRLARHLPPSAASWVALTGEFIGADEAHRVHLVNEIVEPAELLSRAEAVARLIARHPPTSVRVEMEALEIGMEMSRYDAVHHGQNLYRLHRMNYEGYGSAEGFFVERKR